MSLASRTVPSSCPGHMEEDNEEKKQREESSRSRQPWDCALLASLEGWGGVMLWCPFIQPPFLP